MPEERNIKCEISYDGTNFHGYQIQPNSRTVQGLLIEAIYTITREDVNVIGSGRTDAGVHARKQVFNFKTTSNIPVNKWARALNSVLPDDIVIKNAAEVPMSFHSRYDVKEKTYRYFIQNKDTTDVFRRNFLWHYPHGLNVDAMKHASKIFVGEHDFTAFSSIKSEVENKQRVIYSSELWEENGSIVYQISGNGFLYNMVRIITGTIVEIGRGKLDIDIINELFTSKDRNKAGITAPAKGLFLWDVKY